MVLLMVMEFMSGKMVLLIRETSSKEVEVVMEFGRTPNLLKPIRVSI
jgi:hypothetical protein